MLSSVASTLLKEYLGCQHVNSTEFKITCAFKTSVNAVWCPVTFGVPEQSPSHLPWLCVGLAYGLWMSKVQTKLERDVGGGEPSSSGRGEV